MRRPATDWRKQIIDDVGAPPDGPVLISTGVQLDGPSNEVIRAAARRRGMSPSAYLRRAAVAFATFDLDRDWDEVMADEPGFTAFGKNMGKSPYRPNGHGFGPWKVLGLEAHHADE
jgi:hypothetical protein